MTDIYVFEPRDFQRIGVIDNYVSCIWRPAFNEVGDFELYLAVNPEMLELLQAGRILVRSSDYDTTTFGAYKNAMIIKNIDLITSVENGDYISVTGRELKYLLHQRVVYNQTILTGNIEDAVYSLVNSNCTDSSPLRPDRGIPRLRASHFFPDPHIDINIDKQVTGGYLDEVVTDICKNYNLGWRILAREGLARDGYELSLYQGTDRSHGQTDNPYVVFSDEFENLFNTEYQLNTENYANVAYVAGEGEGIDRKITKSYKSMFSEFDYEPRGLNRFEVYIDARDISSNNGEIAEDEYFTLLRERGNEKLAEMANTEGFSGEVSTTGNYVFGIDFKLGDTVTVINSYGITKNVMVLSSIESEDENGITLIPQFNI